MGGKSKSKSSSSSTSSSTNNTFNQMAGNAQSNSTVAGLQDNLQNNMMGDLLGGFGAMVQDGMQSFGDNPMMNLMGGMMGMPVEVQTPDFLNDFIEKYQNREPSQPVAEDNGWGGVKSDSDAINWAVQKGDITPEEAQWLNKWQSEANDGNNWVDGSGGLMDWDYMNSGLTDQNKGIVDRFHNSVSGNWGGQQQPQQPQFGRRGI